MVFANVILQQRIGYEVAFLSVVENRKGRFNKVLRTALWALFSPKRVDLRVPPQVVS